MHLMVSGTDLKFLKYHEIAPSGAGGVEPLIKYNAGKDKMPIK